MADLLQVDSIAVITRLGDDATDIETAAALREALMAMKRLVAIKAAHHRYETITESGKTVFPSLHGWMLHELLYGAVEGL